MALLLEVLVRMIEIFLQGVNFQVIINVYSLNSSFHCYSNPCRNIPNRKLREKEATFLPNTHYVQNVPGLF